ncbi:MAG: DUF3857 domain-containing protein [Bacteroidota bacterium]|nr:DUF3857 domain-containing protein [Bacteroidota bacterium]
MNFRIVNIFFMILLPFTEPVLAKDIKYKVSDMPKELKENARSVIRNEEIVLEVKSLSKAIVNVTYAITILNKNGLSDAYFQGFYDKFTKISEIKGRVFDENGEQIKRIPSDDILDYSAISGFSIYEDNRVKYIDPKVRNFPFTVEYSYQKSFDGLFSYPSWNPQPKFNLAVEKSSYKATVNESVTFRYMERNTSLKATVTSDAENNIYYWEARNLKALEWEPYSVTNQEIFPCVITAPADFEIERYKGNLTSWENFGKFISTLNAGKNVLSDETKKFLNELVAGTSDDFGKIQKIYEYMQGRTRYVSIQVGLGGYQPFGAITVQRLAYGDCKALTNYMKTMLEAIGLKANYCLVNAGETAPLMLKEFPSTQFNHAFLSVPIKNDTVWLECTSQRMPCGFIGNFTDDRDVLLIDNDKSKVVHSRVYGLADNRETHTSHVKIDENGKGSVEIHNVYNGLKYDDILPTFLADDTDKKRRISERMKFPSFQVLNFKYKENKALIPSIEETLNVDFENYLNLLGSRYFLLLNFSNKINGRYFGDIVPLVSVMLCHKKRDDFVTKFIN